MRTLLALCLCAALAACAEKPAPVPPPPVPAPTPTPIPEPEPPVPPTPFPDPVACKAVENRGLRMERSRATSPRIVGGTEAPIGQYPWMASIQYSGGHYCGGTVADSTHILTAAHCRVLPGDRVVVGKTRLSSQGGETRTVVRAIRHADYNSSTNENDISLLTLDAPVSVRPVEFGAAPQAGTVTAVGWGVLFEGSQTVSDTLQHVDVAITDNETCNAAYGGGIVASMMCADEAGKSSCQGDSGGPILYNGKQVGITSFGIGCARPEWPGVYARVSAHLPWLEACLHDSE